MHLIPSDLTKKAFHNSKYKDNWGAGCSMGELLLGKPLMNGKNEIEQIQRMVSNNGPHTALR